jgi:hypothetical protein
MISRLIFILLSLIIGGLCAWYGPPLVKDNKDAINILITVYTVFAGFLVAIIAVIGDPFLISPGSWQTAENNRKIIKERLIRYTGLFALYLLTIGIIFISILLRDAPETTVPLVYKVWIARIYLFLGGVAFTLSFALPLSLMKVQQARIDAEIERRRKKAGIK